MTYEDLEDEHHAALRRLRELKAENESMKKSLRAVLRALRKCVQGLESLPNSATTAGLHKAASGGRKIIKRYQV